MVSMAVSFEEAASKRLEEAASLEKRLRLESFLKIPCSVSCFSLRQPTLLDILKLEYAENKLTTGEEPELDDYLHLVIMLSGVDNIKFIKNSAKIIKSSPFVRDELKCFYNACFNDMPSFGSNQTVDNKFDSSVWLCSVVDTICESYGWSLDEVLNTELSTCLQLMQRIFKRQLGDKYAIRNGITQQVKAEILNELNNPKESDGDTIITC